MNSIGSAQRAQAQDAMTLVSENAGTKLESNKDKDFLILPGSKRAIASQDLQLRQWTWLKYADGVWKLTVTFVRLIHGYCFPDRVADYIPNKESIPEDRLPLVTFVINCPGFQLKSQHVDAFIEYLFERFPHTFDAVRETTVRKPDEIPPSVYVAHKLAARKEQHRRADMFFVPVIFSSRLVGMDLSHIVLIEINFKNKAVYYYDSQGIKSSDPCRKVYPAYDIVEDLQKIKNLCFPDDPEAIIRENNVQHQEDLHNCGVYCCDYMERRLSGESFDTIEAHGKSSAQIEEARIMIGVKLGTPLEFAPQASAFPKSPDAAGIFNSKDDF